MIPCQICGAENYSPSMGGPGICPACDCGFSTSPRHYRELREENEKLRAEVIRLLHERAVSVHRPSITVRSRTEDEQNAGETGYKDE